MICSSVINPPVNITLPRQAWRMILYPLRNPPSKPSEQHRVWPDVWRPPGFLASRSTPHLLDALCPLHFSVRSSLPVAAIPRQYPPLAFSGVRSLSPVCVCIGWPCVWFRVCCCHTPRHHTKTAMKRTDIKRRPLADTVLSTLEPEAKEYRESYGTDRLYFVVSPSGRKRWELRYKKPSTGRWAWMGLGAYPDNTAKAARRAAIDAAELVADGVDPVEYRQLQRKGVGNTFQKTAQEWYQHKIALKRSDATLKQMRLWLDRDAYPSLAGKPIDKISRADCAAVQSAIEKRGAFETAHKSRSWLSQIFGFAIAHGRTENNPASNLGDIAAAKPKQKQFPHLIENELPDFLRALRTTSSGPVVVTAAWMVVRTASRPGMVRWAEWSEIDGDEWRIPAEKMKMRRDHVMSLSRQVVEMLEELRSMTGHSRYLFAGSGGKVPVISDAAINSCFAKIGYKLKMTGHGSRHTAKTLLSEHGWPKQWTEMQLAHKPPGLEGTYNKAAYIKQRRVMMSWYSDYLDALEYGMTEEMGREFAGRVIRS